MSINLYTTIHLFLYKNKIITVVTSSSVTVKDNQTPVISNKKASKNIKGIIITNPLKIEIRKDFKG